MATTEHTLNDALAALLRETRKPWRDEGIVSSENTGMLKGSEKRPDILITEANVSPVVVETEVHPAVTVESEAVERLGQKLRKTGRVILSSLAVRLPLRLRSKSGKALREELGSAADLEFALFTGSDAGTAERWPQGGWLIGNVADLSILIQSASVPPKVIEAAADILVDGVNEAAGLMAEMLTSHPAAIHKISTELRQEDGEQTRRMAATILANAFVFQESLAGGPGELACVGSIEEMRASGGLTKAAVLAEWRNILHVNYWPIFDIARRILQTIPTDESKVLIESLTDTASRLVENRLMRSHDLTGAVFQRLIADRKFLAAYYTTPASAALLVGLTFDQHRPPREGTSWSDPNAMKSLRVADFACGTGTLLSSAYQRIGQLYEMNGGDAEALHPTMMGDVLVGCDVLPAAAHLTASMLSGLHPTTKYKQSCILTVAYGKQFDGGMALGSLDLLDPQRKFDIVAVTAKAAHAMGEGEQEVWASLPHASFDVVIMNPPFTRPTGHEGKKIGVPNPMFAAFNMSDEDQKLMGKITARLTKRTSAHGNAGEASIFLVLAHRKIQMGGRLALVMPLSLMSGEAWEDSRKLLASKYSNLVLLSIAGDGKDFAFSADTGMGECLVVGTRNDAGCKRATFVVLNERPQFPMIGANIASQVRRLIDEKAIRRLEEGPTGGTGIRFGDDVVGYAMEAPADTAAWNLARIADMALAQSAYQLLQNNRIWLPSMPSPAVSNVPIVAITNVGTIGPYHADINGKNADGSVRGPLDIIELEGGHVPTYPVLWAHVAARETTLAFDADSEGQPKLAKSADEAKLIAGKVKTIWGTASHCHFNRDFQFNSQATGMQYTHRRTIGGRAWLSISLASPDHEKALVLWANTSLGFLLHWWHANKQQAGRGNVSKIALQTLPVLDVRKLSAAKLEKAAKLFDEVCSVQLLPLHQIDVDTNRHEIDRRFYREVLGLPLDLLVSGGPLEVLRLKLAREPSIRGQK